MSDYVMHPDELAEQAQRSSDYIRARYGDRPIPTFRDRFAALHVAEAIEADEDPGLTGEALDAWNAATARAANIVRNWSVQ